MYLNLVQIAESFGVSENVIGDWIRSEGLPHVAERGRLLFDRAQVANWAATRGLASQAGFLAPVDPALAAAWRLETLLRQGGIWRDVARPQMLPTLAGTVDTLPGVAAPTRQLVRQRILAPNGLTMAPVGKGFALPHPSARIALGRGSGTVALVMLAAPLEMTEPTPDGAPIANLLFFIAPTPRAHLEILGRLSRLLTKGPACELIRQRRPDDEILAAVAEADAAATAGEKEATR